MSISCWESILPEALHAIRSLLCTATNCTPHERMFGYQRRSASGHSLPTWLQTPGKVYLRKFVKQSKYDPSVVEVELIAANPQYAHIRYQDGRESSVSIRDLAPLGPVDREIIEEEENSNLTNSVPNPILPIPISVRTINHSENQKFVDVRQEQVFVPPNNEIPELFNASHFDNSDRNVENVVLVSPEGVNESFVENSYDLRDNSDSANLSYPAASGRPKRNIVKPTCKLKCCNCLENLELWKG